MIFYVFLTCGIRSLAAAFNDRNHAKDFQKANEEGNRRGGTRQDNVEIPPSPVLTKLGFG